ncbi:MAG: dockerin type I domain-containing protein [Clostridia bacterium]|nr:dockerin type I domain-containing protein [Clostridia bacterium]
MKKFTKLFLSCAAVAAVTAAVATSAMAAEKTLTASYATNATTGLGEVTITCDSTDDMQTLLILKPNASKDDIKTEDILQIDQAAKITKATISALNEETDKGKYTVLVGGTSGDIYVGSFKIGSAGVLIGDADLNEDISLADATAIIQYKLKGKELSEEALLAADANQDEDVSLGDATAVIQYKLKGVDNGYIGKTN